MEVRRFLYDAEHPGRMTEPPLCGRAAEIRYRYDETGRVTERSNPEAELPLCV
ncbi:hypothetical protein KCP69_18370 [Salmonella enterica subsp. enterica]|nr:hypothetical protein KCP69_18370 [Salmonella enterica subsp. enterica]